MFGGFCMSDKRLYRFYVNCGRDGFLDGLFISTEKEINELYNRTTSFGEVLGKHSEIEVDVEPEDIQMLSADQDKIEWLHSLNNSNTICGHNPINYFDDEDEDYDD